MGWGSFGFLTPLPSMNWSRWKQGLLAATITGLLTGLGAWATLTAPIGWLDFSKLLALNIVSQALMYLKQHPADGVSSGQTDIFSKSPPTT